MKGGMDKVYLNHYLKTEHVKELVSMGKLWWSACVHHVWPVPLISKKRWKFCAIQTKKKIKWMILHTISIQLLQLHRWLTDWVLSYCYKHVFAVSVHIGVNVHWCACHTQFKVQSNEVDSDKIQSLMLTELNKLTSAYRDKCAVYDRFRLLNLTRIVPNEQVWSESQYVTSFTMSASKIHVIICYFFMLRNSCSRPENVNSNQI